MYCENFGSDGNEIVSDKVEQKSVYKKDSARAMVDILTGVIKRGTARGLGLDNGQPSARQDRNNQ